MPHLAHLTLLIQVHQIDRELHEERVDRFTGHNPQSRAGLQAGMLQQSDPAFLAGVGNVNGITQKGVAGLVPYEYLQF